MKNIPSDVWIICYISGGPPQVNRFRFTQEFKATLRLCCQSTPNHHYAYLMYLSLFCIKIMVKDIMCCPIWGWLYTGITPRWFFNREFSIGQPSLIRACGSGPQCCGAVARYDREQRAARLVNTRKRAEFEAAWQSISWQLLPSLSTLSNVVWEKHCSPFSLFDCLFLSPALSLSLCVRWERDIDRKSVCMCVPYRFISL